jgi:hypothetical protein
MRPQAVPGCADAIAVDHRPLSGYRLEAASTADGTRPVALFCDNETNDPRLFGAAPITDYPKDGINDHVITGAKTVNPDQRGTKASVVVHDHGTGRGGGRGAPSAASA